MGKGLEASSVDRKITIYILRRIARSREVPGFFAFRHKNGVEPQGPTP